MFRKFRIMVLLYILLLVAGGTWLSEIRTTDWDESLWVVVHPIAGDSSKATRTYIDKLDQESFGDIERFFAREAARYGLGQREPITVRLGKELAEQPPAPPVSGNPIGIMFWSLGLRWWSWQVESEHDEVPSDVRMYVVYHDPQITPRVADSLGLQKGLIGITHAFATQSQHRQNNFVMTHELLHTVGASDKYDPATNLPIYPIGFAEPNRDPAYPQRYAEIMGGRIPKSPLRADIPKGLSHAAIGMSTALEIGWRE